MPGTCSVDTSPLLYLYRIGQLTLLRRHYDRVLVPEAVVPLRWIHLVLVSEK